VARKPADRSNQRRRTRKDLLEAAARLIREGRRPTLEEVAEAAMISRATAYRYFQGLDALLLEAALDVDIPGAEALFADGAPADPVSRALRVNDAFDAMMASNETQLRMMLIQSLERSLKPDAEAPTRQNRRSPLIDAALAPARDRIGAERLDRLAKALALIIGTEGMVVAKDVLQLDDAEAGAVKRWAIQALVEAALAP
jgi:AcrR family transcriptional regulator